MVAVDWREGLGRSDMGRLTRSLTIPCIAMLLAAGPGHADCMKDASGEVICGKGECQRDRYGRVYCAAFRDGSAVRTSRGQILCGKGECVTTSRGEVFCSTVWQGAAQLDRYGAPRCEGRCEPASADYCEARPAGTS
jgi:hypothetical protein